MIANNLINKLQNKRCKFIKKKYLTQGFRKFQDQTNRNLNVRQKKKTK